MSANFVPAIAAIIAIWGVITQRLIARRKATIDFLNDAEKDQDVIKARKKFIELTRRPGGLVDLAEPDKRGSDDAEAVRLVLNQYELISIGVQRGILDLVILKLFSRGAILTSWDKAAPFILALREKTHNPNLFYEFEQLAWWLKETKRPKRSRWLGLFL